MSKDDRILNTWFLGVLVYLVAAFVVLVYFIVAPAFAQTAIDANTEATYPWETRYTFSGTTKTFSWCQPEAADPWTIWPDLTYELQITHFQRGTVWIFPDVKALSFDWVIPRTGHYTARVRAVTSAGISDWTESTKDSPGEGACPARKAWWLFAWVAPAGGPVPIP